MVVFILALVFLKVDDTVYFSNGIVHSKNPRIQMSLPVNASVLDVKIHEGQVVKKGDTLMILQNTALETKYQVTSLNVDATKEKIQILERIIATALLEKENYETQVRIQLERYHIKKKLSKTKAESLLEQNRFDKEKLILEKSQYQTDSILYKKGVISRIELGKRKQRLLKDLQQEKSSQFDLDQHTSNLIKLKNNRRSTTKSLEEKVLKLEQGIHQYRLELNTLKTELKNLQYNLTYLDNEKEKLVMTAPYDGTIPFVFNTKQNKSTIEKGTPLVIIAPEKEQFYAKINLMEESLLNVKNGQKVQLKLDAYNYYVHGAITGTIDYIAPSEIDNQFYGIVSFDTAGSDFALKAGYGVSGDIVVGNVPIYSYAFSKLFKKL